MIISENSWTYKESPENFSLKRLQRLVNYPIISKSKSKLALIFHAISKYKAILSLAVLLIFQFSLYDYNYAEYINLSLV